ncbi:MAG: heavy metal translocating P-type ATPase, partial [Aestuariivirga sp.]
MSKLSALYIRFHNVIFLAIAGGGLSIGLGLWWLGFDLQAEYVWFLSTTPILVGLLIQIITSLRHGDLGLDIVAALSMSAALTFGQPLAGNVVALMYSGGQILEIFAQGRAKKEMTALLGRVAHTAMRYSANALEEVSIASLIPRDRLLIRKGEVLPVDGHVSGSSAVLDLAALTGESLPKTITNGGEVLSGSTSVGSAFDLIVSRPASESTYAGIVRLVEAAQSSKAPMARMADRYAIWFLVFTVVIAGTAWLVSNDPLRALAVLVVATPCPLILAVPVAIISGMSRAAKAGILIKSGGVLEALAQIKTAVLDKTGTLTDGLASVTMIRVAKAFDEAEVLRLAASLDQASGHIVAQALITEASARGLVLTSPKMVTELPGSGLKGVVDHKRIAVGSRAYVQTRASRHGFDELYVGLPKDAQTVAVSISGHAAGVIVLQDRIRPDAKAVLVELRAAGISRIVLASGDRSEIADVIGKELGIDKVLGDLSPSDKVAAVQHEAASGRVMMVGDGVNDAPALAAADVGVAMGARGTASSSEAAGVVLLVDELAPLVKAITIARHTRVIALQSVIVGLGLSIGAMFVAAFGYLPPIQGALFQEVIDVAVILNG